MNDWEEGGQARESDLELKVKDWRVNHPWSEFNHIVTTNIRGDGKIIMVLSAHISKLPLI